MEPRLNTETDVNNTETYGQSDTGLTQGCSVPVQGWVYFIRVSGAIKIGFTADVTKRLSQIQTCNPHPIELLGKMPGTLDDERKVHLLFRHLLLRAEWFHDDEEIREYARLKTPKPKREPRKRKLTPRVPQQVAQWLQQKPQRQEVTR